MVGLGCYKWHQIRSLTSMWGSLPFGPVMGVCLFGKQSHRIQRERCIYMGGGGGGGGGFSHPTSDKGETS